ncbi:MAG: hypothetical protein KJ831_06170, partial [Candidatus Eisenbacteria bacterium]|nr:hypothetical protein [Candidatus Eisenbacteria bacterium]
MSSQRPGRAKATSVVFLMGCFLVLLCHGGGFADSETPNLAESPRIRVLQSDETGVSFQFDLPDLVIEAVSLEGTDFHILSIPGGELSGDIGQPALPTFSRLISIPDQSGLNITLTVEEEEILSGHKVMPMQEDQGTVFAYDPAAYSRNDFGATPVVRKGDPAIMAGQR